MLGFTPDSGPPGTLVKVVGAGFDSVLVVRFGGAAAGSLRVVSSTHLKAVVPADAATGPITVETPRGTLASARWFVVGTPPARPAPDLAFAGPRPNPATGSVSLGFTLPQSGRVRLVVFDVHGRRVKTVLDAALSAGEHQPTWNGRDERGMRVAPGAYRVRLEAAGRLLERPLILRR